MRIPHFLWVSGARILMASQSWLGWPNVVVCSGAAAQVQPSALTSQFRCTIHCPMTIKLLYLYLKNIFLLTLSATVQCWHPVHEDQTWEENTLSSYSKLWHTLLWKAFVRISFLEGRRQAVMQLKVGKHMDGQMWIFWGFRGKNKH